MSCDDQVARHKFADLLVMILSVGVWLMMPAAAKAAIPQQERDALTSLYNASGGNNWVAKGGWLGPAGSECSWYGVTCDEAQSHVVGLDLHNNGLSYVTLWTDSGSLPKLQIINLSRNDHLSGNRRFSGDIKLDFLKELKILDISYTECFISGSVFDLPQLTELNLHSSRHIEPEPGHLPPWLFNLRQLKKLDMGGIGRTFRDYIIPPEIGNLQELTYLDLGIIGLKGVIPPEIGNLRQLTVLKISTYHNLRGGIPPELGNLTQLTELDLSANSLTGSIPPELGNLTQLTELDLSDNWSLTGSIPVELCRLAQLKILDLGMNALTGSIPPEIGNLRELTVLRMSYSFGIGGDPKRSIPPELGNLIQLTELNLSHAALTGRIPAEIGNFAQLKHLDLWGNTLTGSIPPEIANLIPIDISRSFGQQSAWKHTCHIDPPHPIAIVPPRPAAISESRT